MKEPESYICNKQLIGEFFKDKHHKLKWEIMTAQLIKDKHDQQ